MTVPNPLAPPPATGLVSVGPDRIGSDVYAKGHRIQPSRSMPCDFGSLERTQNHRLPSEWARKFIENPYLSRSDRSNHSVFHPLGDRSTRVHPSLERYTTTNIQMTHRQLLRALVATRAETNNAILPIGRHTQTPSPLKWLFGLGVFSAYKRLHLTALLLSPLAVQSSDPRLSCPRS